MNIEVFVHKPCGQEVKVIYQSSGYHKLADRAIALERAIRGHECFAKKGGRN